jgi:hypothetical protein
VALPACAAGVTAAAVSAAAASILLPFVRRIKKTKYFFLFLWPRPVESASRTPFTAVPLQRHNAEQGR